MGICISFTRNGLIALNLLDFSSIINNSGEDVLGLVTMKSCLSVPMNWERFKDNISVDDKIQVIKKYWRTFIENHYSLGLTNIELTPEINVKKPKWKTIGEACRELDIAYTPPNTLSVIPLGNFKYQTGNEPLPEFSESVDITPIEFSTNPKYTDWIIEGELVYDNKRGSSGIQAPVGRVKDGLIYIASRYEG